MIRSLRPPARQHARPPARRGAITILTAIALIMILAMVALTVDVGYIAMTKTELQSATDAAAFAGGIELLDQLGAGGSPTVAASKARTASATVAQANISAGNPTHVIDEDVEFGRRTWNADGSLSDAWGSAPYNLIRVTSHMDRSTSTFNDKPINLFFAPVLGTNTAALHAKATVVVASAGGFTIGAGSTRTADVLPIAYDLPSWNSFVAATSGTDNYKWNASTGTVSTGSDGVREFDLYPYGNQSLTPGNRGTVDFGSSNNSTADLKRQIVYGLNASDLSYFPNSTIRVDTGPISVNGDTGISAGIENSLISIIGQTRAIPIFSAISGPGNNAQYTIVKFVGVRIMYVKLNGSTKKLVVQPAAHVDKTAFGTTTSGTATEYIYVPPRLIH